MVWRSISARGLGDLVKSDEIVNTEKGLEVFMHHSSGNVQSV